MRTIMPARQRRQRCCESCRKHRPLIGVWLGGTCFAVCGACAEAVTR